MKNQIKKSSIYTENELSRCLLCNNPPCSKVCGKIDTGKIIRSYYFKNKAGAALRLKDNSDCATCETQNCIKACIRGRVDLPIDIPFLMDYIRDEVRLHTQDTIDEPNLKIDFCGIECENPFVLGSSVISSNYEMCASALEAGWGGIATKTVGYVTCKEVSPRFEISEKENGHFNGFKNFEQISEHSIEKDLKWIKRLKKDYPTKLIIVSIMGSDEKEWGELAQLVTENGGADIIECNFSCPQMTFKNMGSDTGENSELVELYTRACKTNTHLPILAKLTPNLSSPDAFVEAAMRGGAIGISGINTIKSLTTVDFHNTLDKGVCGKTAISGYSGKAVKPIALRFMRDTAMKFHPAHHSISGIGGIETWRDALDFIMIGASNLQVCTAVMEYGQRIIEDLTEGLKLFMKEQKIHSLQELVGCALKDIIPASDLNRSSIVYPVFDLSSCVKCGRCYLSCRDGGHQAIELIKGRTPNLIVDKCVGCQLCRLVCPVNAISEGKRIDR